MKEDTTFDNMVYTILEATADGTRSYESLADEMKPFGFTANDLQLAARCDDAIEKEIQHQCNLALVRAIVNVDIESNDDAA